MIYYSNFDNVVPNANYYHTAFMADATGQADGAAYATDESRHAHALTFNGNAQILSNKFEFDGTGDWIETPANYLFTPGSKFTMRCPGVVLDSVTGVQTLASQYSADLTAIGWSILIDAGAPRFTWSTTASSTDNQIVGSVLSTATSYDISVNWDGATVFIVVNGVVVASQAFTSSFANPTSTAAKLRLGARADNGVAEGFLDGRMAGFLYTKGECLYTAGATHTEPSLPIVLDMPTPADASIADVVAHIGYDSALGRIRDFSPYDWRLYLNGNVAGDTGTTLADGTPSIAFDGAGDYINWNDLPLLEFGSGDYTVEAFVNFNAITTQQYMLGKYLASGSKRAFGWGFEGALATKVLRGIHNPTGVTNTSIDSAAYTPTIGTFYHLAMCRNGSNVRHFIGGVQSGSTGTYSSTIYDQAETWKVGSLDGSGTYLNAKLAELRITKSARYTANFTAPAGALSPRR